MIAEPESGSAGDAARVIIGKVVMDHLTGCPGAFTTGAAHAEFTVQIAHILCTVFNRFPDVAVGDIAADTNVH